MFEQSLRDAVNVPVGHPETYWGCRSAAYARG